MFSKPYWTPLESINSGQGIYNCHFMSGRFLYSNDLKAISNPKFALWSFINILPWSFLIFHFFNLYLWVRWYRVKEHSSNHWTFFLAWHTNGSWRYKTHDYNYHYDIFSIVTEPQKCWCLNLILKLNYLQFLSRRRI